MKSATTRFEKVSLEELQGIIPDAVVNTPSSTPRLKAEKPRPYYVKSNSATPKPRSNHSLGKEER